ncbi:hypothetical protein BX600DRAFT_397030 [Xylariales sp. PMI_506]|nr:hypothetical protein BX600DRAFT_397030 [Xylariales sp. PMI_506]
MATAALHGWHPGEVVVQRKLGFADAVSDRWRSVENYMREQHRIFHTSNLPFIPITTIDDDGRPWASIVAGATGEIGFVHSPDVNTLTIKTRLWDGDPLNSTLQALVNQSSRRNQPRERFLTAGLGIEFPTRRRNKFAGLIRGVKQTTNRDYELNLNVTEALGNCPKYINIRSFVPHPETQPSIAYRNLQMQDSQRLPNDIIEFVTSADTVFVGSVYRSESCTAAKYPSHAGMNARGGLPGFVRVRPSDGRTIVLPDYSGNRFVSSLGNIESSGLAALTFVDFVTGDVLYLTGTAKILIGPPALEIMAKHASITLVKTTGYVLVRDALPLRQRPGTEVERSPYSPKIKYLVEEPQPDAGAGAGHKARLTRALRLSHDLAVFRLEVVSKPGAKPLNIRPGQAIALDFMDWIGPPQYQHMANSAPGSINDDRVRTWTVSSAHESDTVTWFEMTMREMKGGAVTGALFKLLGEKPSSCLPNWAQIDTGVIADIVGITGDFCLPSPGKVKMLWVAGGIGITPFLSMLSALSERGEHDEGDVVFALSTREPNLMLDLIRTSLQPVPARLRLRLDLFTSHDTTPSRGFTSQNIHICVHKGRIIPNYWTTVAGDRDILICGPGEFGDVVVEGLRAAGVENSKIHREGFF